MAERHIERDNRTLATEWAYRQVNLTNDARTAALGPCSRTTTLDAGTAHSEDHPPASRLPTWG
jgi:hypothetical protein